MKTSCPNPKCHQFPKLIIKDGSFKRFADAKWIQRYKCKVCGKKFSAATGRLEYRQQRRRENPMLFKLLNSCVSLRRSAKILGISRGTVERRLVYFGQKARLANARLIKQLSQKPVQKLQIDDLITKENSKLKPLSVTIAVAVDKTQKRYILGAQVAQIPAFGHLSELAKRKYGARPCHHRQGIEHLLQRMSKAVLPSAFVSSDEHQHYPDLIKKFFPRSKHLTYKSVRSTVAGQGELKKVSFDPLFDINHTCAMFRANINRLVRKTWCTTKDPRRLQDHIEMFIEYYNRELAKNCRFNPSQ